MKLLKKVFTEQQEFTHRGTSSPGVLQILRTCDMNWGKGLLIPDTNTKTNTGFPPCIVDAMKFFISYECLLLPTSRAGGGCSTSAARTGDVTGFATHTGLNGNFVQIS